MKNILFFALYIGIGCLANLPPAEAQQPAGVKPASTMQRTLFPTDATKPDIPYGYIEYLPKDYAKRTDWPILLFLHGSGESGDGSLAKLPIIEQGGGPPREITQNSRNIPAVVIAPQAPINGAGFGWFDDEPLGKFVDSMLARYRGHIDEDRLYVTGLSMGGAGTWNYLNKHSDKVAAAIPVCGNVELNDEAAKAVVAHNLPIWAFHAIDDPTVNVSNTQHSMSRIANAYGAPKEYDSLADYPRDTKDNRTGYLSPNGKRFLWDFVGQSYMKDGTPFNPKQIWTLYASGGHGIWNYAYTDDQVYEWLFAQSRKKNTGPAKVIVPNREEILLWPNGAPGALGERPQDKPSITPYLASEAPDAVAPTGAAMVICPGGGYGALARHEGHNYALFLNQFGISCFVLKYRLGTNGYKHPIMLEDAARAVRMVRANAKQWNIDPKKVGIMGSSAGGHLASTLLTHFDAGNATATDLIERENSRPDLGVLCYPVITMGPNTHQGSRISLIGDKPSPELVKEVSNELQVTPQTPTCFIFHTYEDAAVKVENSLDFAAALRRNGVPFDLHIYQKGAHGIGLGDRPPFLNAHPWTKDLIFWLKVQGFVKE